jgi:hypothetical protein
MPRVLLAPSLGDHPEGPPLEAEEDVVPHERAGRGAGDAAGPVLSVVEVDREGLRRGRREGLHVHDLHGELRARPGRIGEAGLDRVADILVPPAMARILDLHPVQLEEHLEDRERPRGVEDPESAGIGHLAPLMDHRMFRNRIR